MAGLSAAYEFAQLGRSVAVLDRGPFAGGMSARTTAHLASELDDHYFELIKVRSEDAARQYFESQRAAIDRIEEIARGEALECDFARVDALLVAVGDEGEEIIQNEFAAARALGFDISLEAPPQALGDAALRFGDQARFHPLKYLSGLCRALEKRGARLQAHTPVEDVEEDGDWVRMRTPRGVVSARHAVIATNSPINDRVAIHTKQAPYRTYAFAAPIPRGAAPDLLIWDTLDPYHYVRLHPATAHDILIVGGEDHKSGTEDDGGERIAALESWARERFPEMGEITHAWSGQVYEPIDYLPHIGPNPGDKRIYVITGDSGEGITSAVAGALIVSQQVETGGSPWEDAYAPSRKVLGAVAEFASENADVVANLTQRLTGGEVDSADDIAPGCGALLREHGKKIAAYRDEDGALHAVSAICTHMGCVVQFNSFERCWDCPCHGSQFDVDGQVLAGPAKQPLKRAET
jgi:glycine/D-amino acid oxidase-like deaminating enzyme/nitrite reductase/ring-hydroxylating ferredoxin subunit